MNRRGWPKAVAAVLGVGISLLPTVARGLSTYQYVRADGSVVSSPALAGTADDELYIAVRGTDDGIYLARSVFSGAEWTAWESLGAPPGGAKGDPALVSPREGQLHLFVRGADNKLWTRFRGPVGGWSAWIKPVGDEGELKGSPRASARGPGIIDVFVLGTDDRVYQRFGAPPLWNGSWISLDEPAGAVGLAGDPTSASHDGTEVALFARGTDNKLWGRTWNGSAWSPWAQVTGDGTLNSSPGAVSSGLGGVVVFVPGTDNHLYGIERRAGAWGGWTRESLTSTNPFLDSPTAAIRPSGHIDVAVRGTDNLAYTYVYRF